MKQYKSLNKTVVAGQIYGLLRKAGHVEFEIFSREETVNHPTYGPGTVEYRDKIEVGEIILDLFEPKQGDYLVWHAADEDPVVYPRHLFEAVYRETNERAEPILPIQGSTNGYHPAIAQVLRSFKYDHLPPHLREISVRFADLAILTAEHAPFEIETTHALRDLLRAKDGAVRAAVFKREQQEADAEQAREKAQILADAVEREKAG